MCLSSFVFLQSEKMMRTLCQQLYMFNTVCLAGHNPNVVIIYDMFHFIQNQTTVNNLYCARVGLQANTDSTYTPKLGTKQTVKTDMMRDAVDVNKN